MNSFRGLFRALDCRLVRVTKVERQSHRPYGPCTTIKDTKQTRLCLQAPSSAAAQGRASQAKLFICIDPNTTGVWGPQWLHSLSACPQDGASHQRCRTPFPPVGARYGSSPRTLFGPRTKERKFTFKQFENRTSRKFDAAQQRSNSVTYKKQTGKIQLLSYKISPQKTQPGSDRIESTYQS
jgi:hypothetical protein